MRCTALPLTALALAALGGCIDTITSSTTTVATSSRVAFGSHEVRITGGGATSSRVDEHGMTLAGDGHLVRLHDDVLIVDGRRWTLPAGWRRLDLDLAGPSAQVDGRAADDGGPLREDELPHRLAPLAAAGIARIEIVAGACPIAIRAEDGRGDIAVDEALFGGALTADGRVARVALADAVAEHATVIVPAGIPLVVTGGSGVGAVEASASRLTLRAGSGAWRIERAAGGVDLHADGFSAITVGELAGGVAAIDARGSASVTIQCGAVDELRVVADGFAHVACAATAERLDLRAEGSAEVTCAGSPADGDPAAAAPIACDGFAHVTVERLRARSSSLRAGGSGEVTIAGGAIDALDLAADGFAQVHCAAAVGATRGRASGSAQVSLPRATAGERIEADGFADVQYGKQ